MLQSFTDYREIRSDLPYLSVKIDTKTDRDNMSGSVMLLQILPSLILVCTINITLRVHHFPGRTFFFPFQSRTSEKGQEGQ